MATSPAELDTSVSEEKVLAAVERIVAAANPVRIVAFGSRARGDFRPSSDLDLAVIVDHLDPNAKPPVTREALAGIRMPVDLLVFDVARHEHMRHMLGSVNDEIDLHGLVLYNREDAERTNRTAIARLVGR
jgi:predicted nucleotidyltransferase